MIEFILTVMVLIVVFIILFWLKKSLFIFGFFFKIFTLLMFVAIVGSILFSYYIVKDATDFKEQFSNNTNIIVVDDNINGTGIVAGTILSPNGKQFDIMNKDQILYVDTSYKETKFDSINKEYYKIFVIDLDSFDDVNLNHIIDRNVNLTGEEIKEVMISTDARDTLAKIVSSKTGENKNAVLNDLAATSEEVKGYILSFYLSEVFTPTNLGEFMKLLSSNKIHVYEYTPLFVAIHFIPKPLVGIMFN